LSEGEPLRRPATPVREEGLRGKRRQRRTGSAAAETLSLIMKRMSDDGLTHLDSGGRARMVDVSQKPTSERWARAQARVSVTAQTLKAIRGGDLKKGDVRSVAEVAGVMAAKRTSELIPLCHPLNLSHVEVSVAWDDSPPAVVITSTVRTTGPTGVEMEALTAVCVAALTVYDMVKAVERGARIADVRLLEKHGGRSGDVVLTD
jgi:cyclic pyranopterin phosphate synthase